MRLTSLGRICIGTLVAICSSATGHAGCIVENQCGGPGNPTHVSLYSSADPVTHIPNGGVSNPYTEEIDNGTGITVTYAADLHWTQIQTGCAYFGQYNINASNPINLLLRAAIPVTNSPLPTAAAGARYEVQLRLATSTTDPSPRVAAWELRRLRGSYPQADHVGGTLQHVPAGFYIYSAWVRLLDAGNITLKYQWITGQGVPDTNPSGRLVTAGDLPVTTTWMKVGPHLTFSNAAAIDVAAQGAFQIVSGTAGAAIQSGVSIDGAGVGDQYGQVGIEASSRLPDGFTAYHHRVNLASGSHYVELYLRTTSGSATVRNPTIEFVGFPVAPAMPGMVDSGVLTTTVRITPDTPSSPQPTSLSTICGTWQKVLEFTLPAASDPPRYSWSLEGHFQTLGNVIGTPYGEVAVEACTGTLGTTCVDMGVNAVEISTTPDGVYFYGDSNQWGNNPGNIMRLWVHKINGCSFSYDPGTLNEGFDIGRRWVAVKLIPLMPSPGCFYQ